MSGNSNKKNGKTNSKSSSNKKPKTYSGVVKSPQTKKVTGKVYIKEDSEDNGIKYGTILLIAVLAGIAALITPLGTALTDQFNYAGQSAADIWWLLAALAVFIGGFMTFSDWFSRGKY